MVVVVPLCRGASCGRSVRCAGLLVSGKFHLSILALILLQWYWRTFRSYVSLYCFVQALCCLARNSYRPHTPPISFNPKVRHTLADGVSLQTACRLLRLYSFAIKCGCFRKARLVSTAVSGCRLHPVPTTACLSVICGAGPVTTAVSSSDQGW